MSESVEKAVWTNAYMNDLPDSAFLYIEEGGEKDEDGKTKPRNLRHFPVRDASGAISIEHVRNAVQQAPKAKLPQAVQDAVQEKARKLLAANTTKANIQTSKIAKADARKHIVYGVVISSYGDEGVFVDSQNDWTAPSEIEKAAHDYLLNSRVIRKQHETDADSDTVVVESFVEPYPSHEDYLKAMNNESHRVSCRKFGDDVVRSGDWVIGVRLGDEDWKAFEQGEVTAFSPGGLGVRTEINRAMLPTVTFVEA